METRPEVSIDSNSRNDSDHESLRLIYFFLCVALFCFLFPAELVQTPLGKAFMMMMAVFWLGRLIEQFVFLPYNKPFVHGLSATFAIGAILFSLPLIS